MTYDEFCEARAGYEAIVLAAVPDLKSYDISFSDGRDGLPHRLKVAGVLMAPTFSAEEPSHVARDFTFFDERDLRRLAIRLGKLRQSALESVARECRLTIEQTEAGIREQAAAIAKLEGELR